jgi:uncharacterized membrane protein YqhA
MNVEVLFRAPGEWSAPVSFGGPRESSTTRPPVLDCARFPYVDLQPMPGGVMSGAIFLRLRYLAVVIVAVFVLHAIGLLCVGIIRAYEAYHILLTVPLSAEARPGIHVAESMDALLFALVMIVVASGTAALFLSPSNQGPDPRLPAWINIRDLSHLKFLIWEAMLVVLVVAALTEIIANIQDLHWEVLTVPGAILLLSVSLYYARRAASLD